MNRAGGAQDAQMGALPRIRTTLAGDDRPAVRYPDTMSPERLHRAALVAALVIAVAIAVGTLAPAPSLPRVPGSDKLHHFIAFAALVFPPVAARPSLALWAVPSAILYGGMIEIIQPFVGRHGEWEDALANAMGALIGAGLGWLAHALLLRPMLRRRQMQRQARADRAGP